MRILVVEDDPLQADVLFHAFRKPGYTVTHENNGKRADHLLAANEFDVVILDLTVPGGMGGRETMEKLLKIDPAVKAIVCSGYSNDPIMTEYAKYGFRGVIAKPYEPEELGKTLCRIIAGSEE